ncbi:hypothetical protein WR25_04918 [Diploscapter pachys]|uniref:Uncharacterized protein n=1 Tax=Diploscapter pachys TaxID=2018661 RepID=A0A2A2K4Y4_9BILA|nr:hypothetical protein WR25_04918 [Diploscapter pachys]
MPGDVDRAGRRRDDAADDADQRRLAGAVRAEQREDFALVDRQFDAVESGEAALIAIETVRTAMFDVDDHLSRDDPFYRDALVLEIGVGRHAIAFRQDARDVRREAEGQHIRRSIIVRRIQIRGFPRLTGRSYRDREPAMISPARCVGGGNRLGDVQDRLGRCGGDRRCGDDRQDDWVQHATHITSTASRFGRQDGSRSPLPSPAIPIGARPSFRCEGDVRYRVAGAVGAHHPVATGGFGIVERGVGGGHERRDRAAVPFRRGDAERCRNREIIGARQLGDPASDHLGTGDGVVVIAIGQDDDEFLAAIATGDVGLAQADQQQRADVAQNVVADGVPVFVVDRLEVIEIDHDDRRSGRGGAVSVEQPFECVLHVAAIVQAGQPVAQRLGAQAFA